MKPRRPNSCSRSKTRGTLAVGSGAVLGHVLRDCALMYDEYVIRLRRMGMRPEVSEDEWFSLLSETMNYLGISRPKAAGLGTLQKSESKRANRRQRSDKY